MKPQKLKVSIPRSALKPEDFEIDKNGGLTIAKDKMNTLVKEHINTVPDTDLAAISVGVVVSF